MAGVDKDFSGEARAQPGIKIGYLEQEPPLDPNKDVRGNVEDGLREPLDALARLDEVFAEYAAEDADITFRLYKFFTSKLEEEPKLKTIYEEIELPLIKNLSQLERKGVLIDKKLLTEQSSNLKDKIDHLEKKAYALAGEEFNLGSPKQLIRILYDRLELPILKKTPKGQPSTAESVLQELAYSYPLPKLIIEYRALSKLKSTYTDQLPRQIFQGTGRVHTSYHQAVTATGRLSSSNPNLQNIPIRSEEGRQIRKAFIARENCKIIAADYSQIELRIMAHLSEDQGLISAFQYRSMMNFLVEYNLGNKFCCRFWSLYFSLIFSWERTSS